MSPGMSQKTTKHMPVVPLYSLGELLPPVHPIEYEDIMYIQREVREKLAKKGRMIVCASDCPPVGQVHVLHSLPLQLERDTYGHRLLVRDDLIAQHVAQIVKGLLQCIPEKAEVRLETTSGFDLPQNPRRWCLQSMAYARNYPRHSEVRLELQDWITV